MCKCREYPARCTSVGLHRTSHNSDKCEVCFNIYYIGLAVSVDTCEYLLLLGGKFLLVNDYRHRVDTRWHMLKADTVLFKHLKHTSAEAYLGVHHILFDVDRCEALFAGDTCDGELRLLRGRFNDERSVVVRSVGVFDVNGYACLPYREDSVLVKHRCAHIGKLTKLLVGDYLDGLRILDDSWVCKQEARNVRPVLVKVCADSRSYYRACYVRTAS